MTAQAPPIPSASGVSCARPLSVLHLSTTDKAGGSGRSAYRIHRGLQRRGVVSRMLVKYHETNDADVRPVWRWPALRVADALTGAASRCVSLPDVFYPSSAILAWHPWLRDSDVLQLYNAHGGYFAYPAVAALSRRRPIVWRLSDMWALTGHCAYAYGCERWRSGCGACPDLSIYPALQRDTTAWHWRLKQRVYARSRMAVVAPTQWLLGLVRESPLLAGVRAVHIPNGVDLRVFRPMDQLTARRRLGLPEQGQLVLFMHVAPRSGRKGGPLVPEIMSRLAAGLPAGQVSLLVAGSQGGSLPEMPEGCRAFSLGSRRTDQDLADVYAAADVLAHPAQADNLPNCILESLACGTPVVTFRVGGCAEAVRHGQTGYVVEPGQVDDFVTGLRRLLTDDDLRARLRYQARELARREFDADTEAQRFEALYRDLLHQRADARMRADIEHRHMEAAAA